MAGASMRSMALTTAAANVEVRDMIIEWRERSVRAGLIQFQANLCKLTFYHHVPYHLHVVHHPQRRAPHEHARTRHGPSASPSLIKPPPFSRGLGVHRVMLIEGCRQHLHRVPRYSQLDLACQHDTAPELSLPASSAPHGGC
jgi:hypothetical protein